MDRPDLKWKGELSALSSDLCTLLRVVLPVSIAVTADVSKVLLGQHGTAPSTSESQGGSLSCHLRNRNGDAGPPTIWYRGILMEERVASKVRHEIGWRQTDVRPTLPHAAPEGRED